MLALLAALLCVLANGFFVAAEFALAKVRPTALEALARQGDAAARRAHAITQRLDAYLSATQLGITLASLALGWLGEPAMEQLLAPAIEWLGVGHEAADAIALSVGFAILSALHIVVGELVPKSFAILRPEQVSKGSATVLRAFFLATYPALWVLNGTSNLVLRALGLPTAAHAEGKLSLDELRLVIAASVDEGNVAKKREIIESVLRAADRPVRAVMVPRVDMQVLSVAHGYDDWIATIRRVGFTRYPLAEGGDPDRVIGYVYAKDLLTSPREKVAGGIGALRRDIAIVPGTRTVGDVLDELQSTGIPIALVVDEYGGTAGLVTLEDLAAELIGHVRDERTGTAVHGVEVTPDGSVVALGGTPTDDVELDGRRLSPEGARETVGAWVVSGLGHLASPGDVLDAGDGWDAVVDDVRDRRVHRVRFRRRVVAPATEVEPTTP
jgi:CBS domain containing-hemolysin-like protein